MSMYSKRVVRWLSLTMALILAVSLSACSPGETAPAGEIKEDMADVGTQEPLEGGEGGLPQPDSGQETEGDNVPAETEGTENEMPAGQEDLEEGARDPSGLQEAERPQETEESQDTEKPHKPQEPQDTEESGGAESVSGEEEIRDILTAAIESREQPQAMDISGAGLESPEMDVTNIYYSILADRPELKVAYAIDVQTEGGILECRFEYMPYVTGDYPQGFEGIEVSSLRELVAVAQDHMGEPVDIKILNSSLTPDGMNTALRQAGRGYMLCQLDRDATTITYSPPVGMTVQECVDAIQEAEALADKVVSELITDHMSQMERARALYSYVTSNVEYDDRYYSDYASMPYESQTALGALRDHLAICGGYSNALKLLFEKAGIQCWNVTGKSLGENHMWNRACIDGQWLWFDSTFDNGLTGEYGFLRFALEELDPAKYSWDQTQLDGLLG